MKKILENKSSVFWSAVVVALMVVIRAFANLFGITLAPDFIDNLMGFLTAGIAFLVVLGVLIKENPQDQSQDQSEKE